MADYIIGTAGHVDHGKSTLIKALTGIDPDRLPEEKERGLTLDLGFAHIVLPSGTRCGIVDVPGHERYLKNMLAGVGGMDFALLVVDAGEGIKEQTREHMEIMQILQVKDGLTIITKIDRVEPDTVDEVEKQLVGFLKDTFLYDSPILRVSSTTGEGIKSLIYTIDQRIARVEPRPVEASFRMPIDRVFNKPGFGTIVTGSVYQGKISEGDRVMVLPDGFGMKVRGLQAYGEEVETVKAGERAAINLPGLDPAKTQRGDQVVLPETARATGRVDVSLTILKSSPQPLSNRSEVSFHTGSAHVFAKVILLDRDELKPGEKTFAQVVFQESLTVFPGDRFIIRAPSAIYTYGGGLILEPYPTKHRRYDKGDLELLALKEEGKPDLLLERMMSREPYQLFARDSIGGVISLPPGEINDLVKRMVTEGKLIPLAGGNIAPAEVMEVVTDGITSFLGELEEQDPGRLGSKIEELKLNLPKMEEGLFREVLIYLKEKKVIREKQGLYTTYGYNPKMEGEHEVCRRQILARLNSADFTPPDISELAEELKFEKSIMDETVEFMKFNKELIPITDKICFTVDQISSAKKIVGKHILKNRGITPSDARQLLNTTRKYIIPLLEYFDKTYFTRRNGNIRTLYRTNVLLEEDI